MEDQPTDSGDLTTGAESSSKSESAPAPQGKRSRLRRRLRKPSPQDNPEQTDDRPVPVGKAGRAAAESEAGADEGADESAEAAGVAEASDEAADDTGDTGTDAAETGAADTEGSDTSQAAESQAPESDSADSGEPVPAPHRPLGRRLLIATAIAGALFVGGAGYAAANLQPYLADRAAVETKMQVARTATDAIETLWSYTPDDIETLPDRAEKYLSPDFAYEYRKFIDAIVATNKQAQVTNATQVMGAAVESLTPTEATAIVYTNSVATSPVTKNIPSLRYLSYWLTLKRDGSRWLITKMTTVTKFDLTPQL